MTTKCKKCNAYRDFRNKRGAKLSEVVCTCGGSFELLTAVALGGIDVVYLNRKNEQFTLDVYTMKFVQK